ncbi:MAG: M28 family peptidase [Phycisphaeraceae bacterium]|nr:M28 family peptidase [Phycisphaeraceae bacterium]
MEPMSRRSGIVLLSLVGLAGSAVAQQAAPADPISAALAEVPEDVRVYNDHLVTLASPFMEGRLPGTHGMEVASDYMEHYFREAGLLPAFDLVETAADGSEVITPRASYRQAFPLGGNSKVTREFLTAFANGEQASFAAGSDFVVSTVGGSGRVASPMVFVGYSIENGPNGYSSYGDDVDLTGKVAVMLRFEPMDENGHSRWNDGGAWSAAAGLDPKIAAAARRGASAVILINTPGADDPRVGEIRSVRGFGGTPSGIPVIVMSPEGAAKLIRATDPQKRSIEQLRRLADEQTTVVALNGVATIDAQIDYSPLMAENIGGLIPGRGSLKDEIIVVGAHLDHLGLGAFGSRASQDQQGTTLHPGADDNASGSAGMILIADWLTEQYANLPEDANARTVLIMAFSGEESGLNGSRYYTQHPIVPIEQHALMLNFDMIGRIINKRLSVSGVGTAEGMEEWLQPFFEDSPLDIVQNEGAGGGSDHLPFLQAQVPVLFGIIADFHGDYHTPADVSSKINRVDAVSASRLFSDITFAAAQRNETFVFRNASPAARPGQATRGASRVRVGVMPGNYDGDGGGVLLSDVSAGGPAESAGLTGGDRITSWNGKEVANIEAWMGMLAEHAPGDKVEVGFVRDGKEMTATLTLEGR